MSYGLLEVKWPTNSFPCFQLASREQELQALKKKNQQLVQKINELELILNDKEKNVAQLRKEVKVAIH